MEQKKRLNRVFGYIILIFTTFVMLFPFFYMFVTACKDEAQFIRKNFFPSPWHPDNFIKAWTKESFTLFFVNSLVVASLTMFFAVLISSMGGFVFSKYRFKGKKILFGMILATMMIPGQVTMIPNFLIASRLGMLDSYAGLIIPVLPLAFGIFMMRQFMYSVPDSLIEAARIDGSGEFGVYLRIILPLCKPALVTLGIFTFMFSWNNFMWPLIILDTESKYTIPIGLLRFAQQYDTQFHFQMAVSLLSILPIMILFIIFQRAFVRGMALTGLKE
jgi:ABC-type glycerol-3-phosphate transport system permease component